MICIDTICRPCMGYMCYHLIFTIIDSITVTVGWYEHMFSADTCNSEVNVDDTKSVTSPQGNIALLSMCGCFVLL